jgi:hypothetical protein
MLGDGEHLQQILFNLLDNAIKFTEHGHIKVHVSARPEHDEQFLVSCTVEDSGIGFEHSPEWLQQHDITQLEDYHTRRHGGVGLGLTLTRRLLQLMEGTLHIDSEAGRGSRVTATLLLQRCEASLCSDEGAMVQRAEPAPLQAPAGAAKAGTELDAAQRQQLYDELRQLQTEVESDLPRALQRLSALLPVYQGTRFSGELEAISARMSAFDSEGVLRLAQSLQQQLLEEHHAN